MKHAGKIVSRAIKWIGLCLAAMIFGGLALASTVSTTTVQGTVYLANGAPGSGTLQVSWPAFTTPDNLAVAAGRTTVAIGADGFLSVNLAPNLGAAPAGLYYTAVYHMSDGTTSTEYWVVPEAAQASLSAVRAQVMPAAQAVQAASKAYVDQAIQSLAQGSLTPVGGSLSGPLYLNGDPTQSLQAADKHYVDSTFSAAVPLSGATMVGSLTGPSITASLNKVLLVTAPPYNAKCDGVTDDQAAIQAAFNDAYNNGYSVEFPAGTCLTSTIVIKGQSFFGHGKYVTTIVGQPGQDVFATPDPSASPVIQQGAHVHDLNIQVNATVNASATAAGGNNTFPNRVTGTAGGLTPLAQPPAPGPMVFGSGIDGNCAGQIIADSSGILDDFYLPCANFANLNAEFNGTYLVGQPISTYNASGTLLLSTTITGVIDATHLKLAASVASAQSNLSGKYMTPLSAPWYVGNCGFAFPMADGQQNGGAHGMISGWIFENIAIGQASTSLRQANHACAIFMQANNYGLNYEHIDTSMLYAGIVEALPYQNAAYVAWTPDTTKYFDVNLSHHILPFVTYNGAHRMVDGLSIYGGAWDSPLGMGAWMFTAPTGAASGLSAYMGNASISRFYFECAAFLSGEIERFSGQSSTLTGGSTTQCGNGGSLGPWMTPAYLNWNVSDGSLDAQVGDFLVINGDHNAFTHTDLTLGSVIDSGFENRVQTGINNNDANLKRAFYANLNMPQDPVGKLTGDFLLNGNSAAPFVSGSDLLTTCRDYRVLTPLCVNDPNGNELVRSYIHSPATGGSVPGISTGSVASWNALMTAGSRIPLTPVYVVTQGRCQGAPSCSSTFYVRDRVTAATIGSCAYTFGSAWAIQGGPSSNPCLVNFAGVPPGDAIGWDTDNWSANGLTAVDISFVGFQPQNADVVSEVLSSNQLAGVIQSGAAGAPVNIAATNWQWNGNAPGVPDPSSPIGYSTSLSNAWQLSAWNGSPNTNGGALYPAVPSTISYLVQAPAVLTNTLAAAMAPTDASLTINMPVTSAYASGGCFQIDQEIVCYSGALTSGSTTIAIARGQYGTLAQAHAAGATLSSVGTGVFYADCNSTDYATTNVVFGAKWSYVSSPFAAQNCSGANTAIHLDFTNGPVGQTYKIAAVQIAQNPGNPQATAPNQVPISVGAGNSQYGWTATKALAGNGAAIPTGPATSTSGNITTFAAKGELQDSGVSLSSVPSLSSTSQQKFAGSVTAKQIGSNYMADQFPGADASVKINACIAAAIAAGGGTCDARALGGAQAMSQQINLGYPNTTTSTLVTLLLPNSGTWTWSLTDGTSCGIRQFNDTALIGTKAAGSWDGLRLNIASGANMDSAYCTDPANAIYARADGFTAYNSGGTVANGLVHVINTYDESSFTNIIGVNQTGDAWHIDGPCCGTKFDNIQGFSAGANPSVGGTPLVINGGNSIVISNSTFNGAKDGDSNIRINGGTNIQFQNTYMEKYSNMSTATPIVYIAPNTAGISFNGGSIVPENCTAGCSQWAFENHSLGGISIKNVGVSVTYNGVNDVANGRSWVTDGKSIREYTTNDTNASGPNGPGGSYVQMLAGDPVGVYSPMGPIPAVQGASVFTPGSTGNYRIFSSNTSTVPIASGLLDIYTTDGSGNDTSMLFAVSVSVVNGGGVVSLLSGTPIFNWGPIDHVIVSNDNSNGLFIDVHVGTVTGAPVKVVFYGQSLPLSGIVPSPVVGSTPGSYSLANLQLGGALSNAPYGLVTTGQIQGNGNVSAGGGSNIVYRCTTAGALPAGALTIATGNCGASTDSGLRVK